MHALIEIEGSDRSALIYPWVFSPLMMPDKILGGVTILSILSLALFILTSKKILIYENSLIVQKYRYIFLKSRVYMFNDVLSAYIYDGQSISQKPMLTFFFDGKKEKIPLPRNYLQPLVSLLLSKKVIVKSNRNELVGK